MDTMLLLQILLLGGLLGLIGQGIRSLAGMKKLAESSATMAQESGLFDTRRLLISLFLGFIAGALGVVTLLDKNGTLLLTKDVVLTLIGIGYAGVDFIESLLTKYVPKPVDTGVAKENGQLRDITPTTTSILIPRLPYSTK